MPFDPISYQLAKKAAARSVINYDRDGDGFIEYIALRKYESLPAIGAHYELAIDCSDGYVKVFDPVTNSWKQITSQFLKGYTGFDNNGGGAWTKYVNIPITTIPSEYAQYKIVIDATNVEVYSADGTLKASGSGLDSFWTYVRSDGLDIRVFDQAKSQLYFWIEEWDYNNQKATIWVNLTAGSTELNIAYGNPSATKSTYENGEQVFEFFDDFVGTELDTSKFVEENVLGKTSNYLTATVENGQLHLAISGGVNREAVLTVNSVLGKGKRAEIKVDSIVGGTTNSVMVALYSTGNLYENIPKDHDSTYRVFECIGGTYTKLFESTGKTPPFIAFINYKQDETIEFGAGNTVVYSEQSNWLDVSYKIGMYSAESGDVYIDWVRVLKLADPADFGTPHVLSF